MPSALRWPAVRLLDWVDQLPHGLDTPVGEHGAWMSGGERQRLAVARALLAGFPLLVVDEPAEHLDPPTADALTADLLDTVSGEGGAGLLLITHRLAGLQRVDEVIVLEAGRVLERGTHDELLAAERSLRPALAPRAGRPGRPYGHRGRLTHRRRGPPPP